MSCGTQDSYGAKTTLDVAGKTYTTWRLGALDARFPTASRLPFSLKVLLENLLRFEDGTSVKAQDVATLASWDPRAHREVEIAYRVARVLLQDFTGVPAVVDLAAMRDAMVALGGDPDRINPLEPADLVIDHSVQVDHYGTRDAFQKNADLEFSRNKERYQLLRWGQTAFEGFRVVPPDTGIVHQVNVEYLARGIFSKTLPSGETLAYPDTLVGTDSHTTMVNGLGVVGWGVGGIEAEAALLGQPTMMLIPQVIGMKLTGKLPEGTTATDLVLTVTQQLRKKGVVEKFVEFYGPGLDDLALPDRATIANMAPEYGATIGFFPMDHATVDYLRFTGRPEAEVALVEAYAKAQGLWRDAHTPDPIFTDTLELDLGSIVPSLAGPKRPQDRVALKDARTGFEKEAVAMLGSTDALGKTVAVREGERSYTLESGSVVIAAITSCTNTSNPSVLIAAGLLAQKAVALGLTSQPWVKTSLAPGSKVVTRYLEHAGLMGPLEALGFYLAGYGCTTCIGNSGPLHDAIDTAIKQGGLVAASVLSGNRNFEGRVHPAVKANYLASPPLVVAYALAGTMRRDLTTEPLGTGSDGAPVYLKDIWPTQQEIATTLARCVRSEMFRAEYAHVFDGDANWQSLEVPSGKTFAWDEASTYVKHPPYFENMPVVPPEPAPIRGARALAKLGDSITTDHISPAGDIAKGTPAARWLEERGVAKVDFNSYGARRGNHEVMVRGTFANVRLRNQLAPGTEGGMTTYLPAGEVQSIFDASMRYQAAGTPLVILAGKEYGTGSSRDWAAKGTALLGVKAVIAESFERIHRANLAGMGVLPLIYVDGQTAESLGLTGHETFAVDGVGPAMGPGARLSVTATRDDGTQVRFEVRSRLDTPADVDYYRHGGILRFVLRNLARV